MKREEVRNNVGKKDKLSIVNAKKVTVDEVLNIKEFEGISRKEAKEYIKILEQYCLLMCQFYIEVSQEGTNSKKIAA